MRIFLSVLLFFLASNLVFSMPGFDANNNEPIVYDVSDNIALRNKLEANYDKKYTKKIDDYHYVDTAPLGAYEKEVVIPYALNKKPDDYKIISK